MFRLHYWPHRTPSRLDNALRRHRFSPREAARVKAPASLHTPCKNVFEFTQFLISPGMRCQSQADAAADAQEGGCRARAEAAYQQAPASLQDILISAARPSAPTLPAC